jgi:hypothetical protein
MNRRLATILRRTFVTEEERAKRIVDSADSKFNEKRKRFATWFSFPVFLGVLASYSYMGLTSEIPAKENDHWFVTHNKRVWHSMKESLSFWVDPPSKKLLPDPLPDTTPPYVLLIELTDTLCHMEWHVIDVLFRKKMGGNVPYVQE